MRGQRKSNQKKGCPDTAVSGLGNCSCVVLHKDVRMPRAQDALERPLPPASMQASCPPTTQRDSGGSPTVHPWTGVELGAIHCAHPAGLSYVTLPLHRGPSTAHPATAPALLYLGYPYPRLRSQDKASARTPRLGSCFGFSRFALENARRAVERSFGAHDARYRAPSIAARLRRNCPKDGPHDVGQFDVSPWMDCRRTP